MKVLRLLSVIAISAALASCGSSQKMTQSQEKALGEEVVTPCSDMDYHTDKKSFRATGIGTSLDLSTSKRKANLNASANLAASVNKIIKRSTEQYVNERQIGDKQTFQNKFEDMTKELVKQEINNLSVICTKTYQKGGRYVTYIAVEVAKDELLTKIKSNISSKEELKQDFEAHKFNEKMEKEMENFGK